jgi:F-type H+-transporting ATPase subunit delta
VGILQYFHRLVRLEVERRSARVESARALSPELQAAVQANLAQSYGSGLTVQFAPNPALVGGLRIKVGSDVFDGSVDARLTALAESF